MSAATAQQGTLTDREIGAATAVVERLGGSEQFALAVLCGSLVAGLGHAHSDVDVHVVLQPGAHLERRTFDEAGAEVQLEILRHETVVRVVETTERYVATRADRAQLELEPRDLWQLIRLVTGRVLLASEEYRELLDRSSLDVARQVVAANHARPAAVAGEDADGMLARRLGAAACHASICALTHACETALAAAGDLYAIDRFLFRRVLRTPPLAASAGRLWDLLYRLPPADAPPDALATAVRERLFAANGLVAHGLLYGWDQPLEALPPLEASSAGGGPVRSGAFGLFRFADAFALAGPGASLRVGELVAALWAELDGRPLGAVAGSLRDAGYSEAEDEAVVQAAASLVRAGAASAPDVERGTSA